MSLIDLSKISKPADTLIKKISSATGAVFEPHQIRRAAKAKADAALMEAESEIQITELHRRAARRWIEEEARHQKNMEDIAAGAIPGLEDNSNPDSMGDDWIANFFHKCRIVSDGDMKELFSRVLSGEANVPGTYSKRTVNFLAELDKADAELFSKLCGFGWGVGDVMPLVFDAQAEIYNRFGLNFDTLSHLESIGLVQFNNITGFNLQKLPKSVAVVYYGRILILEMQNETDNMLELGHVLLTKIGKELAPICGSKPVDGFWEYVLERWQKYKPSPGPEIRIGT